MEAENNHTNLIESVSLNDREEIYFEKLALKIAKQQHQNYSKKLEHLKQKNDIPTDMPNPNIHKKPSKNRRFIPRRKYSKWITPKNDDFLRLRREELWIRRYQSIEFGANKHS